MINSHNTSCYCIKYANLNKPQFWLSIRYKDVNFFTILSNFIHKLKQNTH